jgi:hypothetical protein
MVSGQTNSSPDLQPQFVSWWNSIFDCEISNSLIKSSCCCCFQVDSLQDLVRPSMSMERGRETMEMAMDFMAENVVFPTVDWTW